MATGLNRDHLTVLFAAAAVRDCEATSYDRRQEARVATIKDATNARTIPIVETARLERHYEWESHILAAGEHSGIAPGFRSAV
jgi:hypothetical protein